MLLVGCFEGWGFGLVLLVEREGRRFGVWGYWLWVFLGFSAPLFVGVGFRFSAFGLCCFVDGGFYV